MAVIQVMSDAGYYLWERSNEKTGCIEQAWENRGLKPDK